MRAEERTAPAQARGSFSWALASCGSGKTDDLGSVVRRLDDRQAKIDFNGTEGRFPADADARAGAEGEIILEAGTRGAASDRVVEAADGAEIAEQAQGYAIALGQKIGKPRREGTDGEDIAADRAG